MKMQSSNKENEVTLDPSTIINIILGAAMSFFVWDKRQDKLKVLELERGLGQVREMVARQDERHKALVSTVAQIRQDTMEIKQILMSGKS